MNHSSFLFSFGLFSLFGIFGSSFVFHLLKLDAFFNFEFKLIEQVGQDILEDGDRFGIWFVKVDPDFNTIASWIVDFRRNKAESIDFLTSIKILTYQEKGQLLIDLLPVRLSFSNREDESASFLILLILPFRFDTIFKELNRVDFFIRITDEVAKINDDGTFFVYCFNWGSSYGEMQWGIATKDKQDQQ